MRTGDAAKSDTMRKKGKLVGGEKLAAGNVRHIKTAGGKPVASDGPYAEAKDVISGYFMIEARDEAEAEANKARILGWKQQLKGSR